MKFSETPIPGLMQIFPEVFEDQRGQFVEIWHKDYYAHLPGLSALFQSQTTTYIDWKTDCLAIAHRGVLKGLHGDWKNWKLIDCIQGRIFTVIADLRTTGDTYGETFTTVLTSRTHNQLLIPPGCATGTQCLSDECVLHYKQSEFYDGGDKQFTVNYKDETLDIDWPIKIGAIISERDRKGERFIDIRP